MSDDLVTFDWLGPNGELVEMTVTLDQAVRMQRGQVVCGRELIQRWTREDLAAAKAAAFDEMARVEAERAMILWRHGMIDGDA